MSQSGQSSFRVYVDILDDGKTDKEKERVSETESGTSNVRSDDTGVFCELSSPVKHDTDLDRTRDVASVRQQTSHDLNSEQSENILCGYLNKRRLGTKLNQYKKRWFVCHDNTCQLLYYKTQNDVCPLGHIDISCATFTTELECERSHVFKISSRDGVYLLQAPDEPTMIYWIQELQKKRQVYNKMKDGLAKETLMSKSIQQPEKGLVRNKSDCDKEKHETLLPSSPSLMQKLQTLPHTPGISCDLKPDSASNATEVCEHAVSSSCMEHDKPLSRSQTLKEQSAHALVTLRRKLSIKSSAFNKTRTDRCNQCKQFEEHLDSQLELIRSLKEDLDAKDQVILTLKNHIATFMAGLDTENTAAHGWQTSGEDGGVTTSSISFEMEESRGRDSECITHLQEELENCKDTVSMYQEIIQSKDSIIESLTKRLDELEGNQLCDKHSSSESMIQLQNIQDAYDAYRKQNAVLNQEILELSRLREQDEMRERALRVNYAKLEADYYCVKSKYLVCLRDLDRPRLEGGKEEDFLSQDMVSSLLQEAMDSEAKPQLDRPNILEHQKYDKYGFEFISDEDNADVETRAESLLRRSDQLSAKMNSMHAEISTHVKWENFMQRQGGNLEKSQEVKQLIRLGIPVEYREKIWNFCVSCHVSSLRAASGPNYYSNLLKKGASSTSLNPAVTQIELDLLRTLPNNRYYESLSSDGIPKLRNVLLAYSMHKPDIGYCQGLNRLAAIALLFLDEEDAFWCLVAILEYIMPRGYYTKDLVAAHVDQRVLKDIIADKAPKVHSVIEHHQVDLALFTFNWFMTLFVDNVPVETYLHIWDTFLFEGSKVLFRFAVAFFLYREEEIIKASCADRLELHNCLRSIGQYITDVHKVTQIAFNNINPFPMKYITARRNYHRSAVEAELRDVQENRVSFLRDNLDHAQDGATDDQRCLLVQTSNDDIGA